MYDLISNKYKYILISNTKKDFNNSAIFVQIILERYYCLIREQN